MLFFGVAPSKPLQAHYVYTQNNHAAAYPIYQKIRLSSYSGNQLADYPLIANLRQKFSGDGTFMIGNCLFQAPGCMSQTLVCGFEDYFRRMTSVFS